MLIMNNARGVVNPEATSPPLHPEPAAAARAHFPLYLRGSAGSGLPPAAPRPRTRPAHAHATLAPRARACATHSRRRNFFARWWQQRGRARVQRHGRQRAQAITAAVGDRARKLSRRTAARPRCRRAAAEPPRPAAARPPRPRTPARARRASAHTRRCRLCLGGPRPRAPRTAAHHGAAAAHPSRLANQSPRAPTPRRRPARTRSRMPAPSPCARAIH